MDLPLSGIDWQQFQVKENNSRANVQELDTGTVNGLAVPETPDIGMAHRIIGSKWARRTTVIVALATLTIPAGDYLAERWSKKGATAGAHQFTEVAIKDFNKHTSTLSEQALDEIEKDAQQRLPGFLKKDLLPVMTPIVEKHYGIDINNDGTIGKPRKKKQQPVLSPQVIRR